MGANSVTGTGHGSAELPVRGLGDLKKVLSRANQQPLVNGDFISNNPHLNCITVTLTTHTAGSLGEDVILCDASNNNITINLPPVIANINRVFHVKKIDATVRTVTIDGNGKTIDDGLTAVIATQYENLQLVSNGSAWFVI